MLGSANQGGDPAEEAFAALTLLGLPELSGDVR